MKRKQIGWGFLLTVLVVAELAASLETTMVFAALPAALREFGRPEVSWLATGYLLVAGGSAALCGRLGDIFGRPRVLLVVLGLAVLGSMLAALSDELLWIIVGRAIQGLAGAALPLGYGIAREFFPPARLALGIGVLTAAASLGAALGFVLGGVIVDAGDWQGVFTWSAIVAGVALVICWIWLPKSAGTGTAKGLDIVGGILFPPSIAALLAALSFFQRGGFSATTVALLAAGAAGLIFWFVYELRHPQPLIDVKLLRIPQIALANIACASIALGAYQSLLFMPLLLQQAVLTGIGFGLTASMTGILKLPSNIAAAAGASAAGALGNRSGGAIIILAGSLLCTFAWSGLWLDMSSLPFVVGMLMLSSVGTTIVLTGAASVVVSSVPAERTSEATGMTIVIRMIFQALGASIVGLLLARWTQHGEAPLPLAYLSPEGFDAIAICVAFSSLIGVAAAAALMRLNGKTLAHRSRGTGAEGTNPGEAEA
jgi:MFS family permease